jgi:predicted DNA-binding transcriptional regulator AlpA
MKLYLNVSEVAERYGVNPATVWRWRKDGGKDFPQPRDFGPQTKRWKVSDLEAFEERAT